MTTELSKEKLEEYRSAFEMFDLNNNGLITSNELSSMFHNFQQFPTKEELKSMIDNYDTNSQDGINFEGFCKLMQQSEKLEVNEMKEAFSVFDQNHDGLIDQQELHNLMKNIGEEFTENQIAILMNEIDFDKDGAISFEDFKKLFEEK
ncbi:calmodulin [Anaeramoeba flamelloides]|uniref:Calmodulin n=1 Tax=Anaeramoeba flamelloides TaxID=1746091 RepID=A0AAV7Z227_9EUKA|nr:calmodulin [Anaeramoeba flamelloides]KAJ6231038.1 calmodulin [Anaeramoeba flamelloides]